jgi:hypothetical protein
MQASAISAKVSVLCFRDALFTTPGKGMAAASAEARDVLDGKNAFYFQSVFQFKLCLNLSPNPRGV